MQERHGATASEGMESVSAGLLRRVLRLALSPAPHSPLPISADVPQHEGRRVSAHDLHTGKCVQIANDGRHFVHRMLSHSTLPGQTKCADLRSRNWLLVTTYEDCCGHRPS